MPEHIVCFVRIPASQEKVDEMEAANPQTMEGIITPATKYIKRHVRAVADGVVIEVDEYASREDYDAFMTEAKPAIREIAVAAKVVPIIAVGSFEPAEAITCARCRLESNRHESVP